MKPDETPAPPEGYRIIPREWLKTHELPVDGIACADGGDWIESSWRGFIVDPDHEIDLRFATRTPVPPTESSSIGSKSVVEGQEGEQISNDSSIAEGREGTIGTPVTVPKGTSEVCTDVTISETPDSSTGSENQASPAVTPLAPSEVRYLTDDRDHRQLEEIREYLWPNQDGMPNKHRNCLVAIKARGELANNRIEQLERETIALRQQFAEVDAKATEMAGELDELRQQLAELKEENAVLKSQVENADVNLEQVRIAYKFKVAARDVEIERLNEVLAVSNTITQHFFLDGKKHELRCNPGMGRGVKGADVRAILNTERKLYSLHFDDLPDGTLSAPIQDTTCIENGRKIVAIPEAHA